MNKISTPYISTLFLPFVLFILCLTHNYKLAASDIRGAEIQWKHISAEQFEMGHIKNLGSNVILPSKTRWNLKRY